MGSMSPTRLRKFARAWGSRPSASGPTWRYCAPRPPFWVCSPSSRYSRTISPSPGNSRSELPHGIQRPSRPSATPSRRAPRDMGASDFFHVAAAPTPYRNSRTHLAAYAKRARVRGLDRPNSSQAEPDKPHERQPIADLVFDLLVGQVIERLLHQNLEHHHICAPEKTITPPGWGRYRTVIGCNSCLALGRSRVSVLTYWAALARDFAFHS